MSILNPGFSERVFEFSFNAEYADRNRAVLAGAPHIPTQNEEKWLGYDIAIEVKRRGGAIHTVALQHKVARFVDNLGPGNGHFWDKIGGPYFAFRLDTDQYNLIESIASSGLPGVEFHFCAPTFASRDEMNARYQTKTVEQDSVWISVDKAGQITDDELHTIVYSTNGARAFRFSQDAVSLAIHRDGDRRARKAERQVNGSPNTEAIYETAFTILQDYWPRRKGRQAHDGESDVKLPKRLPPRQEPSIGNTAKLLAHYFGASVLVEVHE